MADEPEQPERKTPPPPDIKKGPPPAPVPSALDRPPAESAPPPAPLKVSVAEDSTEDDDEEGGHGSEASLQDRVIATVIDVVVCIGINTAFVFVPGEILDSLGRLAAVAYLLTRDSLPFLGGQSVGKKAMRIQAVTTDGKSLSGDWKSGLIRNVVLLIPFFPLVELFVLISRQDKPGPATRLGDEWGGTKVINVEEPVAAEAAAPPAPPAEPGDGE